MIHGPLTLGFDYSRPERVELSTSCLWDLRTTICATNPSAKEKVYLVVMVSPFYCCKRWVLCYTWILEFKLTVSSPTGVSFLREGSPEKLIVDVVGGHSLLEFLILMLFPFSRRKASKKYT